MATAEIKAGDVKSGDVKDIKLADAGKRKIEWAGQQMPVLESIRKRFLKEKPLKGLRVSACLHVTSETANLMIALRDGGGTSRPLAGQSHRLLELVARCRQFYADVEHHCDVAADSLLKVDDVLGSKAMHASVEMR